MGLVDGADRVVLREVGASVALPVYGCLFRGVGRERSRTHVPRSLSVYLVRLLDQERRQSAGVPVGDSKTLEGSDHVRFSSHRHVPGMEGEHTAGPKPLSFCHGPLICFWFTFVFKNKKRRKEKKEKERKKRKENSQKTW
mmetsp:Transcript_40478/g.104923  ORF Transcript_40478/g.104923 Transcript_40478/m.104923 type:complete len:140 (+) Transcript_40478:1185-1604(+)